MDLLVTMLVATITILFDLTIKLFTFINLYEIILHCYFYFIFFLASA